jgi:hypothetical protein
MKRIKLRHILIALFAYFLAGIVIRFVLAYVDMEHAKAIHPVQEDCTCFEYALYLYKANHGVYPIESNALSVIVKDEDCRKLLTYTNLNDPWGTPFRFRIIDGRPVVDSAGPDRKFDTPDDVKSWQIDVHVN